MYLIYKYNTTYNLTDIRDTYIPNDIAPTFIERSEKYTSIEI